jgi:hypothetical protein
MFVGGPPGAALGGGLATAAGHALGLELEGLSAEDAEFEVSRQFVRFAGAAVDNAVRASSNTHPSTRARDAATQAARAHGPGLMDIANRSPTSPTSAHRKQPVYSRPPKTNGGAEMEAMEQNYPGAHQGFRGSSRYARGHRELSEEEQMDLAAHLMEAGR